jgi:hypothetical protein
MRERCDRSGFRRCRSSDECLRQDSKLRHGPATGDTSQEFPCHRAVACQTSQSRMFSANGGIDFPNYSLENVLRINALVGRASLGQPPKVRRRRLKSLSHSYPQYSCGDRSQRARKDGAFCDQCARVSGLDEVIDGLRESGRSRHSRPRHRRFDSGDGRFQRRVALYPNRDLRPYSERAVDLGHRNDITWPLGGVRPYGPYILGARRGVGRPAERAFRLTHVGHLRSFRTAAWLKRGETMVQAAQAFAVRGLREPVRRYSTIEMACRGHCRTASRT